ncbi:MAG: HupE/UreJ family protein [Steroidobacteraceae bacterium]|nr:HupE/UreJ family protein [Nevskiaceae bacterium]MCP5471434.1 HupE/UreJ family protein [Nevskiaceae bacterium]
MGGNRQPCARRGYVAAAAECVVLAGVALLPGFALAHGAHAGDAGIAGGFMAGALHPLGGLDHLLAMVAVGIWGAFLGAPLIWVLPVAFPLIMVVGGILGVAELPLPYVETGIALSVLALGLAIALAWRAPRGLALALVGAFAVFHGYAHGAELPAAAQPAAYAAGFVIVTGLLHLAGIGIGYLAGSRRGTVALRTVGAGIAVAGVWILLGQPGLA